jgi:hypothetical protein
MVHQISHIFTDTNPIRVIDLFGTDEVSNFVSRKVVGDGGFYIGNENVSPISYGFSVTNSDGVYFPQMDLKLNPDLHVCGDVGVGISILAWK